MKNWILLPVAIVFTFISCGGNDNEVSTDEVETIDSNYCECFQLTFDEAYNHFYRFERREPFTGNCKEFWPDGTLKLDKNFVEGKVHGKMISYHENGQIHEDQEFDMNFQVGERIIYTKSGQVKFHALYERGKQVEVLEAKPWLTLDD